MLGVSQRLLQHCLIATGRIAKPYHFIQRISGDSWAPRSLRKIPYCQKVHRMSSTNAVAADPAVASGGDDQKEAILLPLRKAVQEQADVVRKLKEEGRPKIAIQGAVAELKVRKKALEKREEELTPKVTRMDRSGLEDLLKRRFFYTQSFSIYGGVGGLYDYGPMGCAMKTRMLSLWRSHFVLEEGLLEVDCSMLTPEYVLKTSGHTERFSDLMVKDLTTGECFRADHVLKDHLEKLAAEPKCTPDKNQEYNAVMTKLDGYSQSELTDLLQLYEVKSPLMGNPLSPPTPFNLMFPTTIGPGGALPGFLRPETAQGMFVNFKRLLEFNAGKLPFGAAQIGRAFRNEISPRAGLLRVREFDMAEIEYFVNPTKKDTFSKFQSLSSLSVRIYSACDQMEGRSAHDMNLGDAVKEGVIGNETLGYFIGRIQQFLLQIGVAPDKLRFRQHMSNEMAHYAKDCWDAECHTSYGWVECVGCADRSCYDLSRHAAATKVDLTAKEPLSQPRTEEVVVVIPEKGSIGKTYRKDAKALLSWLDGLPGPEAEELQARLQKDKSVDVEVSGKTYKLEAHMVNIKHQQRTVHVEDVLPSVIEPSFGIGRLLYVVWEHCFRVREGDEQRVWLALPPQIAPISCSVLPLSSNEQFNPFITKIVKQLKRRGIAHRVDEAAGSIGRRYARTDEIGIPFGITVDFDTVKTSTVTLRERNSTKQVRLSIEDAAITVAALVEGTVAWQHVETQFPIFTGQEST